jgi:RNA polymerase sigma-70 factor (ECF subfamily)
MSGGDVHAAGRSAWPDIELSAGDLARWIEERDCAGAAAERPADIYLACACANGDPAALAAFESYLARVPLYLAGNPPDVVDEVRQRLRVLLFTGERPRIRGYSGRGSLASWLKVAAVRTCSNLRRDERTREAATRSPAEPGTDVERAQLQARYKTDFEAALKRALELLEPRERTLLKLHFLDGVSLDKLALMFDLSRATMGRRVASAREHAVEATFAELRARLDASDSEVQSLVHLVQSQLELSLRQALAG